MFLFFNFKHYRIRFDFHTTPNCFLLQSGYLKHHLPELIELFKKIYPNEDAPLDDTKEEEEDFITEEYRVPSCSYRMGVPNMAYGAAYIGKQLLELFKKIYPNEDAPLDTKEEEEDFSITNIYPQNVSQWWRCRTKFWG